MRPDTHTSTEAGAAAHAALLGRQEDIGVDIGDQSPSPWLARKLGPDPWDEPVPEPEEIPLGHCDEEGCEATYVQGDVGGIRAHEEGWFFMKDGRKYCPDHNPPWVAEWRARRAAGIPPEPWR